MLNSELLSPPLCPLPTASCLLPAEETGVGKNRKQRTVGDSQFTISAVPLQVEQAQLDTWIDIGRLIVEVGKTL
jgi:hypothetical protein